ncbi:sensor histidine kinase [Anaerobium acetethylicum]|uniref:Two-component system, sensor histidine kinase YesM n=1 Tax=Anaerobium acetethylicum TaxID=1619234 RepID=A0A1D3TW97_9FIRM|nr:sensor histidine kinase [Anaerobium acetethylicum]SCP98495.1 two-component system, sensor histidine kinase YesM [Anaerobium acetethylicum]
MKKTKRLFRKRILFSGWIVFGMLILLMLLFLAGSLFQINREFNRTFYNATIIAGMMMMAALLWFYKHTIINPISKLEDALKLLEEVNDGEILKMDGRTDYLADSLSEVLRKLIESLEREHMEVVLRQESEYAELQSQINPHFLYNTLETIRGQAVIDDNYKIADMTEALAKYFRYNIGKDNDQATVADEIENIYNYIHIQQYRFDDRFRFNVYPHDDSGEYLNCIIPKMTLQPIVENAIFHGVESKIEQGHISIHIETTENCLSITVADDGVGMDEDALRKMNDKLNNPQGIITYNKKDSHNGIAMDNVNKRLKLLFGKEYGIRVSSTHMFGTEVEIRIPKIIREGS